MQRGIGNKAGRQRCRYLVPNTVPPLGSEVTCAFSASGCSSATRWRSSAASAASGLRDDTCL